MPRMPCLTSLKGMIGVPGGVAEADDFDAPDNFDAPDGAATAGRESVFTVLGISIFWAGLASSRLTCALVGSAENRKAELDMNRKRAAKWRGIIFICFTFRRAF